MISFDDFKKVELRVGTVKSAVKVKNSNKLVKLIVDLGEEERHILAGISEHYQNDELIGKQIVLVANLEPRKMMGEESQGMLLAADVDGKPVILSPVTGVPSGTKIK